MLEGGGGVATGLLNKGGGSNRLPGLVTKWNFHRYLLVIYNYSLKVFSAVALRPIVMGGGGVEQQASSLVAKQSVELASV